MFAAFRFISFYFSFLPHFICLNGNEDHSFQKLTLEDCKDGVVNTVLSNSESFIGGELFNSRKYMLWSLCERELNLFWVCVKSLIIRDYLLQSLTNSDK